MDLTTRRAIIERIRSEAYRAGREDAARAVASMFKRMGPNAPLPGTVMTAKVIQDWAEVEARGDQPACSCPDCDVTAFNEKPGSRTVKGLDPACPVHGGDRLTEKSCLLVDGAHARHAWSCSTPGCAGHVCLGSISLGRSSGSAGDNPEEQRP